MILVGKAVVRNNTAGYCTPDADENVAETVEMTDQDTGPEQTAVLSLQIVVVAVVVVEAAVVASAQFSASCHCHQNP